MNDELSPFYTRELTYLRQLGDKFAREHPAAADALRLGENNDAQRDPHVERLLQGIAFLNARIHQRLDNDFPELAESLLNTLYPHYLTPVPSCAIAEMRMDEAMAGPDSASGRLIEKNSSLVFNQADSSGSSISYYTAYDVHLLPVRVSNVNFYNEHFESPAGSRPRDIVKAALRIELETITPDITFDDLAQKSFVHSNAELDPDVVRLRFYIDAQPRTVHAIYEQMLRDPIEVISFENVKDDSFTTLSDRVIPVGFQPNDSLLPRDGRIMAGFRLLHEYFAFPQKFHFVDVLLPRSCLRGIGHKLQIMFMTKEENETLAGLDLKDSLKLGCTPVVNLFDARTSFDRNYRESEYQLGFGDRSFPPDYEIFSVKKVSVTTGGRPSQEYRSFYNIYHASDRKTAGYWHAHRRQFGRSKSESVSEVYLSLADHSVQPDLMEHATVSVDVICMNRNYPQRGRSESTSEKQLSLLLTKGDSSTRVFLVTRPTSINRRTGHDDTRTGDDDTRAGRDDWRWRLCSHLALNHLSLIDFVDGENGANALKEILRLYNYSNSLTLGQSIDGLVSVVTNPERILCRVANGPNGFARGNEVTLTFREGAFSEGGMFLFASVLRAFLANYCSINSFVKTVIHSAERNRKVHEWKALSGTRQEL